MMKKIALSAGMLLFVGAVVATGTGAFFSDIETSTGNTFTAGALDLRVDSQCHYYQNGVDIGCRDGEGTFGNWSETDLVPGVHKFFDFDDVKPGDEGETTISLHVYDNDAWGGFEINRVLGSDRDNSCTEPETGAEPNCDPAGPGELDDLMVGRLCLDQGAIPGFQNINAQGQPIDIDPQRLGVQQPDPTEGDNICQVTGEFPPEILLNQNPSFFDVFYNLSQLLSAAYDAYCPQAPVNGANNYGPCQGIADDGRMVGSTTYYFAWEWALPAQVGNEAQTDSISGDVNFYVVQHRNNPGQSGLNPEN